MTSSRGNTTIIVIIIVLGVLLAGAWYWNTRQQKPFNTTAGDVVQPAESPCGLTITSPVPASSVSVPFSISGTVVISSAASCRWTLFEGQAGTVEIRNANTNAVLLPKTPVPLTQTDWMDRAMNGQPVDFSVAIPSLVGGYTGPATIIFEEENPSGEGVPDVLMLNIIIQ